MNGDSLAVGAIGENSNESIITNGLTASADNSFSRSGAVYVYKRTNAIWEQEAYIKASNNAAESGFDVGDQFGWNVSLDGNSLAVGVPSEDSSQLTITNGPSATSNNLNLNSGAVYIYKRFGALWQQEAFIKAVNVDSYDMGSGPIYTNDDQFGHSISLSADTLVVGSINEDSAETFISNGATASFDNTSANSGAVYVYRRVAGIWGQEAYIKASNSETGDAFGHNVVIKGNHIVVGVPLESSNQTTITQGAFAASSDNSSWASGAVYIYKRTGSNWDQEAYIKASNNDSQDYFGSSIAFSGDTLAFGANNESSDQIIITNGDTASTNNSVSNSGAVYIYRNDALLFDPSDFQLAESSLDSMVLNWSSAGNKAVGYIIAYNIGSTAPADCTQGTVVDVGPSLANILNGLLPSSLYSFRICSYDASNNLSEGFVSSFQTVSAAPEVASLATVMTSHSASLSWISGEGATTGFKVAYQEGELPEVNCSTGTIVDVGMELDHSFTGLELDTFYGFRVCSYDGSNVVSVGVTNFYSTTAQVGWYQEAYIKAVNADTGMVPDYFGYSVSISGDTLAVGAYGESSNEQTITNGVTASSDNSYSASGAVYVYKRTGVNWKQQAYIKAVNNHSGQYLGHSLFLNEDTLAVSSPKESGNQTTITNGPTATSDTSIANSGAVYIYKRTAEIWEQEAYIKAVNGETNDEFGTSLALSGNYLAVGVPKEASNETVITNGATASGDNTAPESGAVYIYTRSGSTWEQQAYIKAVNANNYDNFGQSVALDGETLAVGAPREASTETIIINGETASVDNMGNNVGATFVYQRTGSTWKQQAYLKHAHNPGYYHGQKLSLSGDTLAVADGTPSYNGSVLIYQRTGSTWAEEAYLSALIPDADDGFGMAMSISGNTLVIGASGEDSDQTTIINNSYGQLASNLKSNSGATYVYKRSGTNWEQEAYIKAINSDTNDSFGSSVSLSGDTIVVGAHQESNNQNTITNGPTASWDNTNGLINSGAVYIYRNDIRLFDPAEFIVTSILSDSFTFNWNNAGRMAAGYIVTYDQGTTPPANCAAGTPVDVANVLTTTITGLLPDTFYSFRICAYDDQNNSSEGVTSTFKTLP